MTQKALSCWLALAILGAGLLACKRSGGKVEVTKVDVVHKERRGRKLHYLEVQIKGPPKAKLNVIEPAGGYIETDASGVGKGLLALHPERYGATGEDCLDNASGKAGMKLVAKTKTFGIESEQTYEAQFQFKPGVFEQKWGEIYAVGIPCTGKLKAQQKKFTFSKYFCKGVDVSLNGVPLSGEEVASADGLKILAKMKLKDIRAYRGAEPGTPALLSLKYRGQELKAEVPIEGKAALISQLAETIAYGKGTLPGGPMGKPSLIWISRDGITLMGDTDDTVESVDYVANEARVNFKRTGCGVYRSASGSSRGMTASSADSSVIIWDQHSGNKVAAKTFKAPPPRCSGVVSSGASGAGSSAADPKAIRRWLEAQLAR